MIVAALLSALAVSAAAPCPIEPLLSIARNRVFLGVRNVSARDRRLLRRCYGPALVPYPLR